MGDRETGFLGFLVSFLATRGRTGILASWSEEHLFARRLERLGQAAWADTGLLRQVRPVGDEHLVRSEFRGSVDSHYLAAMAAARRAVSPNRELIPFVERLRVLVLIRALESAAAEIPRESNLKQVCAELRQVCEDTQTRKWAWIARIAHGHEGIADFVSETRHRCLLALAAKTYDGAGERAFLRALVAVLEQRRISLDDPGGAAKQSREQEKAAAEAVPEWERRTRLTSEDLATSLYSPGESDEGETFTIVDVDAARPAPAQRDQATGLILQSLEEVQHLRHSWHHLSTNEERALLCRLDELLRSTNSRDQVGAALVALALLTSTVVSSLGHFPLSALPGDDWALDLHHGTLHRRPPRFGKRWRADGWTSKGWVRPLTNEWRIELPHEVLEPLRAQKGKARIVTLGGIWNACDPLISLESWFSSHFASVEALERLTSPAVALTLGQQVFDGSGDHVLSRLIASNTRTGLPAACTYGSFTSNEVRDVLRGTVVTSIGAMATFADEQLRNAAGSELDLDLVRLGHAIRALTGRVNSSAEEASAPFVEYHNRLSALCVVALLASTGARPVTSPFESVAWIDVQRRLIYVEDKHSGPSRGARLCVLSDFAHDLLVQRYVPHLQNLAEALTAHAPRFAAEVGKVLSCEPECQLPMFFQLRVEPSFDWTEISETLLSAALDSPWPLPWNLFRHLHSTQLRRWGLHPDIRDALLSHGDHGAESHGDFSWRTPANDLEIARPLINRLAAELNFSQPSVRRGGFDIPNLKRTDPDLGAARPFGRAARRVQRERTHAAARQKARSDLAQAIKGRPTTSLAPEDWDKISRQMLLRADGLPHVMAWLRHEVFEEFLATAWRKEGVVAPLSRRHIPLREGSALFDEDVIPGKKRLKELRDWLEQTTSRYAERPPRPVLAGLFAALELLLYCRVGNFSALCAVVCNSAAVQVVRFSRQLWLEWAYQGDWRDGRPVYRVPITERAAAWIGLAQSARKRLKAMPPLPEVLRTLPNSHSDSGQLLKSIAEVVSQRNSLDLPGVLAAVLNGRRESSALPHGDWIREVTGSCRIHKPDAVAHQTDGSEEHKADDYFRDHHRVTSVSPDHALVRCRTLFEKISAILAESRLPRKGLPTADDTVAATPARRATEIIRVVKASGFGTGEAPFLVAHYAHYLLTRPNENDAAKMLKASTARRYWYALAPGFLDFAFDANLVAAEDDELTELYAKIVRAAAAPPSFEGNSHRKSLKPDSDASQKALSELKEFHEFARARYGLEDPDWSEITPGAAVGRGRPGTILVTEYEAALTALVHNAQVTTLDERALSASFVLLACARFGLRTGEAVGLQRNDWVDVVGSTVVLVRSNSVRGLKTTNSKRHVPLIGQLSSLEQSLVQETIRRWNHREGSSRATLLLPGVSAATFKYCKGQVSSVLLALLKSVTRNPECMVHHLRHSFASRVLSLLCGRSNDDGPLGGSTAARRLLLGADHPDRRTLWSVARLLGHGSCGVSISSYCHVFDSWIPTPVGRAPTYGVADWRFVLDLDTLPRDADYLAGPFEVRSVALPEESLFLRYLRYLRLRALGHRDATSASQLAPTQQRHIDENLATAVRRLAGTADSRRTVDNLLSGISVARWNSLVELARNSSQAKINDTSDWSETVGANRQVLMFLEKHFAWVASFAQSLGLAGQGFEIVKAAALHESLEAHIDEHGLRTLVVDKDTRGKGFQIDVAIVGSPEQTYRHRVALIPKRPFANSIELLTTWVAWVSASSKS